MAFLLSHSGPGLRWLAFLGLGLVKLSTFTEKRETQHEPKLNPE
jgi:hypothetical protein